MKNLKISPSLLSSDMARLAEAVEKVAGAAEYVHLDVMDGHFVPNLTFGAPVVRWVKKSSTIPLDVHLMIENPGRWIDDYFKAGLHEEDFLTIHIEAENDIRETLKRIRTAGVRPGLAIKPKTELEAILEFVDLVDQVLIMTVEPGFGGQKFMRDKLYKVKNIREKFPHLIIGVDGGIDTTTAPEAVDAGADLLVAGTAVYGESNPAAAVRSIKKAVAEGNAKYRSSCVKRPV